MSTRTALIVGAGIGGLSAAIALRQAGWNIRIFERANSPRELGFGVGLARSFAPAYARGEVRRLDGTVVKRTQFPPPNALGGPMVMALRPALHGALVEAVGLESISLSREATGFTVDGDLATLHLANGEAAAGQLLIGADGVSSIVRRILHPTEPPPRSSGIIAVRGAVHGALRHFEGLGGIYYLDRGVEAAMIRASETGIYWFVSLARELVPPGMSEPAAILSQLSPRCDSTFRAITSATEDLRFDELTDRDPIPFWGYGPVTLLGDAAHPLLPHTGQGAAQAIVDAVTLGTAVAADSVVERALRSYERERRQKTAALLAQGRRTARLMRTMNPAACYIRELVVRAIPVKTMVKLLVKINRRAGTDVTRGG